MAFAFNVEFEKFAKNMESKIVSYSKNADASLTGITNDAKKVINENIVNQRNYTGEKARELKRKTVVRKIFNKRPYPTRIFYDSGLLARPSSVQSKKFNSYTSVIYIISERANILFWLAQKGRNPFGLTNQKFAEIVKNNSRLIFAK